jgi:acyl carrier protein
VPHNERESANVDDDKNMEMSLMRDLLPAMRSIWRTTLEIDEIRDDDHFFLLGGDSLLGSIVVFYIAETFGPEITLLDLYENPTLIELCSLIELKRLSVEQTN